MGTIKMSFIHLFEHSLKQLFLIQRVTNYEHQQDESKYDSIVKIPAKKMSSRVKKFCNSNFCIPLRHFRGVH